MWAPNSYTEICLLHHGILWLSGVSAQHESALKQDSPGMILQGQLQAAALVPWLPAWDRHWAAFAQICQEFCDLNSADFQEV